MGIDDPVFGIHARALQLWNRRTEVLAANIANADTPHYKARDLSFSQVLESAASQPLKMATTHARHQAQANAASADAGTLLYRMPHQPAADGNSVEVDVEQAQFADNALRYQTSLRFLSGRINSLRHAISGGQGR